MQAIAEGIVVPHQRGIIDATDYAQWDVVYPDGTATAQPGDYLIYEDDKICVCPRLLFELTYTKLNKGYEI